MKRKYIILGVAVLVALILLMVFRSVTGSGTIEISAPAKTPDNKEVIVEVQSQGDQEPMQSFKLRPGESRGVRVKNGFYRVNGSVGNLKSVDVVRVKGASTTTLETPTGEQRAVKQLASNAIYCPAIFGDKPYSYICNGEGAILKHDSVLGVGDAFMFDAATFNNLEQVKNGLLGYYSVKNPDQLLYIEPHNASIQPVSLPAAVQQKIKLERPVIISQKEVGSSRFLLVFSDTNHIYLFQDVTDKNPKEIKLDKGLKLSDRSRGYSITFEGGRIVIYAGANEEAGEGTVGAEVKAADVPIYLFEYDTAGKQVLSTELPRGMEVNSFHKLTHNFYAVQRPFGVDFYHHKDNEFSLVYTLQEVSNWAIHRGKLFVQAGGTLYEFVPREGGEFSLQSRFTSSDFSVSELYTSPRGLLFTAFAGNDENSPLNIYELLDTKQEGNKPALRTQPSFQGLDPMLYYGLTEEQLNNLKAAFQAYADSSNITLTGVSATNVAVVPRNPDVDNPVDVITFEANVNDVKFLKAKIEYSDLTSIRLYLFDKMTGAQIFDSKNAH